MRKFIDSEVLLNKISKMIEYCRTDKKVSAVIALYQVFDAVIDCPYIEITAEGLQALKAHKIQKAEAEE